MFKKREKKEKVVLNQEEFEKEDKNQEQIEKPKSKKDKDREDIIKIGRKKQVLAKGVDPSSLVNNVTQDDDPTSVADMVGLIETKYLKEREDKNEDDLQKQYVNERLENYQKELVKIQPEDQAKEFENLQKIKQEKDQENRNQQKNKDIGLEQQIKEYERQANNFMSQGVSTTWSNGIMEVKVSLEQKAENLAKMEELRRKQLLYGVIKEETLQDKMARERLQDQNKKNLTKTEQIKQEREFLEFSQKFFKQGRAHKNKNFSNTEYNKQIEKFNN